MKSFGYAMLAIEVLVGIYAVANAAIQFTGQGLPIRWQAILAGCLWVVAASAAAWLGRSIYRDMRSFGDI